MDGPVTEVEFVVTASEYPFVEASRAGGEVTLEEMLPWGESHYVEYFSVSGTDPDSVAALAGDSEDVEGRPLAQDERGGLVEFVVGESCPAVHLCEHYALPRSVSGTDGEGRLVADVPASEDACAVVESFLDAYPSAKFVGKQRRSAGEPMFGRWKYHHLATEQLTDRQREILAAAHESGYYDWPRETTGEELAAELDIAPATLYKHLRTAERRLVSTLFESDSRAQPR